MVVSVLNVVLLKLFLLVQPLNDQLEALPDNCYYNVDEQVLYSVSYQCSHPHVVVAQNAWYLPCSCG